MRRLTSRDTTVKFAMSTRTFVWLTEVVREFSQRTVDGMSFTQALLPWSVALTSSMAVSVTADQGATFIKISPQSTKAHGDEQIITASRELLQPVIDMLAILVDGDRNEVQHLDRSPADGLHRHLCDWYRMESLFRADMRTRYRDGGESTATVHARTDDLVIQHIHEHPGISLKRLCAAFDIPWCVQPDEPPGYGYSPLAEELRHQLQRLRRTGQLTVDGGQRWHTAPLVG